MKTNDATNYYITQEMIVRAELNHYWDHIKENGKNTLEAGGKVIVGVTDFVKSIDFDNWLAKAKEKGK
ncbi:MAG: hypothetical protein ACO1G9_11765 [Bacteroidota bacterium]